MMASGIQRVAFCATVDWYFCHHYLDLAQAVRDEGYAVSVITGVTEHAERIRAAGLELIPFKVSRKGMHPWRELRSIIDLTAVLRRLRPHLLHNIAQKPVIYGTLAGRLAGVPAIVNGVAGMGYLFTAQTVPARLVRTLVAGAYRALLSDPRVRVLVQNQDDRALVETLTGVAPTLIPGSGVDLERFIPRPEQPTARPLVMLASRMLWDKGIGDFVAAARLLRQRGNPARCVLVGKPDPDNPASVSAAQLAQWHQEGVIEWWGHRADIASVLAQAQIACLPSYYREGLPKFLIEAAATGLPLVTTDSIGCREAVIPEVNGLLVPPQDPSALADALERLIADAPLRARLGAESRAIAESRFGRDQIAARVKAVYRQLLDHPPRV
ncbi:MAG: glycosyltransferase family 1 protein [Sphingobacteriia bacterium]|nr:glycosyltransferase family 1 protein [Sphingobacteriia bacterium]NCC40396.1 glycosyltransferase family 1 protein [Gammaproteobacteria bacterium]